MIIVHLTNYFQPALGYQELFLAKEHKKLGHDVYVVTSDRYFPFPDYDKTVKSVLGDRIVGEKTEYLSGIKVIRLKTIFEYSARVKLAGLAKTLKEIKPDIVICHGISNFNALEIIPLKKKLGFKLIYDEHMIKSVKNDRLSGKIFYKLFNFRKILKNSDKIVGVADTCVDFIVENYKFPREKVTMIPLGADTEIFKFDTGKRDNLRKKLNIPEDNAVVVYTGKLTFAKGPANILHAADMIKESAKRKVTFLFVGNIEENYKDTFSSAKKKLENVFQIINIDAVKNEDLVEVYSASDVACWPRQSSMSMIEAASCSLPIICCDFLTERYKNNNGIPVKEDDIEALSSALLKLVNNSQLRKTMGDNGRVYIEKSLSWKKIASDFIRF
ncbi:MAG TPA: glycosyltransferase family 4 protein [Spirochaetota bacterium]|nr:glycosyltransferase family 4 protein [Spirochaetota bacterium]